MNFGDKGGWKFPFSADQRTWDEEDERKPSLERKPDDWEGKIKVALTMDERCEITVRRFTRTWKNVKTLPRLYQKVLKMPEGTKNC